MTHGFHDLSREPEELARVLQRLGLGEEGVVRALTPLTGGVSSNICRVDLGSKRFCLKQALPQLKVAKEWHVSVDRVYAEIDWLRTAGRIAPGHVPNVIGVDRDTNSFVMEFLPASYLNWKQELMAGRVDANVARQMGDVLGRIHAGTARNTELAARFAHDDNFHAIRLEPYLEEAARQNPAVASTLRALIERTQMTREALVHGDVSPKNILLGPAGPVVLDAECACYGDPAFDVAFCLTHFLLTAAWSPALLPRLLACFGELVDRYAAHIAWTAPEVLLERVATLLGALLLARVDGKSPVEYLNEESRKRVRNAAIALLARPASSPSRVASFWETEFSK